MLALELAQFGHLALDRLGSRQDGQPGGSARRNYVGNAHEDSFRDVSRGVNRRRMTVPSAASANNQLRPDRCAEESTTALSARRAIAYATRARMRVRVLTSRYVGALVVVAGLLVAGQTVIYQVLARQEGDARVINLAGRQRLLGQRLCTLLLALDAGAGAPGRDLRGELSQI